VEAQECKAPKMTSKMIKRSKELRVTPGTTISHPTFLHRDLTNDSYCNNRVLEMPGGHQIFRLGYSGNIQDQYSGGVC
jgi:hypothetical protein